MSGETLNIERTFQAPARAVFDAWTSEEVLRRWFYGQPGWATPEAEVDLRLGGPVRVVMRNPQDGAEHGGGGHYTEIDPPTRLAFTWTWGPRRRQRDPDRARLRRSRRRHHSALHPQQPQGCGVSA
jgi:uncharacterized protein YndB with AHSA1/START domain